MIVEKKGKMNKLQNLKTGEMIKRLWHDEELAQTYAKPEEPKEKIEHIKPHINPEETIAKTRPKRQVKKVERLDL